MFNSYFTKYGKISEAVPGEQWLNGARPAVTDYIKILSVGKALVDIAVFKDFFREFDLCLFSRFTVHLDNGISRQIVRAGIYGITVKILDLNGLNYL